MTVTEWAMPTVDNIRAEMARKRKRQTELAAVLGIAQSGVSARMSGKTPLTVNEIYAIARWLEVSPIVFFADLPEQEQRTTRRYGDSRATYSFGTGVLSGLAQTA